MIDIAKACELVTKENNEPFVSGIIDIGHSFVISTLSKEVLSADVSPSMVDKETGIIKEYFPPDHFEEISQGKNVDIPKEYRWN